MADPAGWLPSSLLVPRVPHKEENRCSLRGAHTICANISRVVRRPHRPIIEEPTIPGSCAPSNQRIPLSARFQFAQNDQFFNGEKYQCCVNSTRDRSFASSRPCLVHRPGIIASKKKKNILRLIQLESSCTIAAHRPISLLPFAAASTNTTFSGAHVIHSAVVVFESGKTTSSRGRRFQRPQHRHSPPIVALGGTNTKSPPRSQTKTF